MLLIDCFGQGSLFSVFNMDEKEFVGSFFRINFDFDLFVVFVSIFEDEFAIRNSIQYHRMIDSVVFCASHLIFLSFFTIILKLLTWSEFGFNSFVNGFFIWLCVSLVVVDVSRVSDTHITFR